MAAFLTTTGVRLNVHSRGDCDGNGCTIHAPSDHHMKDWPTDWRGTGTGMERVCSHGVGHPDPDHVNFLRRRRLDRFADSCLRHGCCSERCCEPPSGKKAWHHIPMMAKAVAAAKED